MSSLHSVLYQKDAASDKMLPFSPFSFLAQKNLPVKWVEQEGEMNESQSKLKSFYSSSSDTCSQPQEEERNGRNKFIIVFQ